MTYAAGTGHSDFLTRIADVHRANWEVVDGEVTDWRSAVSRGLSILSSLLTSEITTLESIAASYAGGFEIAYCAGSRLKKLDDITFLFWSGQQTTNGLDIELVPLFLKLVYQDDVLLVARTLANSEVVLKV